VTDPSFSITLKDGTEHALQLDLKSYLNSSYGICKTLYPLKVVFPLSIISSMEDGDALNEFG
jgi:hypothetical protein